MMILQCCHSLLVCEMDHPVNPVSLSVVELHSSTCTVNIDGGK